MIKACCFNGPEYKLKHVNQEIEENWKGLNRKVDECENFNLEMCDIRNDKATVLLTG